MGRPSKAIAHAENMGGQNDEQSVVPIYWPDAANPQGA